MPTVSPVRATLLTNRYLGKASNGTLIAIDTQRSATKAMLTPVKSNIFDAIKRGFSLFGGFIDKVSDKFSKIISD